MFAKKQWIHYCIQSLAKIHSKITINNFHAEYLFGARHVIMYYFKACWANICFSIVTPMLCTTEECAHVALFLHCGNQECGWMWGWIYVGWALGSYYHPHDDSEWRGQFRGSFRALRVGGNLVNDSSCRWREWFVCNFMLNGKRGECVCWEDNWIHLCIWSFGDLINWFNKLLRLVWCCINYATDF